MTEPTPEIDARIEDIESTLIHERLSVDCADECSDDCGACAALALIADLRSRPVPTADTEAPS